MTTRRKVLAKPLSLKDAYETEFARREMQRRARDEAERKQQAADLADAGTLHAAFLADPDFLASRGLTADRRRYTVSLDHDRFRISAYFEGGKVGVTLSDKRAAAAGASAPRRQETAESVSEALRAIAQMLVEEIR